MYSIQLVKITMYGQFWNKWCSAHEEKYTSLYVVNIPSLSNQRPLGSVLAIAIDKTFKGILSIPVLIVGGGISALADDPSAALSSSIQDGSSVIEQQAGQLPRTCNIKSLSIPNSRTPNVYFFCTYTCLKKTKINYFS